MKPSGVNDASGLRVWRRSETSRQNPRFRSELGINWAGVWVAWCSRTQTLEWPSVGDPHLASCEVIPRSANMQRTENIGNFDKRAGHLLVDVAPSEPVRAGYRSVAP